MKILYLIIASIICFSAFIFSGKNRKTILITLAIGGAVNANFFNATAYPIYAFGLPFGIDSILYTLFIFCVVFAFFNYSKKEAYSITISSVLAIGFSAIVQFVSGAGSFGIKDKPNFLLFLGFLVSILATIIAVVVMIKSLSYLQKKNVNYYLSIFIGILIATLINSVIYYSLTILFAGKISSDFWQLLATSFIGKGIALVFSVLTAYIIAKMKKTNKDL